MCRIFLTFYLFFFVTIVEAKSTKYNFNIISHNENYLFFGGYTNSILKEKYWNDDGKRNYEKDYNRDKNEAQFQISFKIPLRENLFNTKADFFFAYTQNSFWQIYDKSHSAPFRETNYMPEFFLRWNPDYKIGDSTLKQINLSLVHQSNGQDLGASRSWNRTQLHLVLENQNFTYGIDIWDRWDEDAKENYHDSRGDDNPNLEQYIGRHRLFMKYELDNYGLSISHQNDIFDYHSSKGNTKFDITLPSFNKKFDFFIRYFNGYGESLIDYDVKVKRVSFGIIFTSWN